MDDDLHSLSFNSTATTLTEINLSNSSFSISDSNSNSNSSSVAGPKFLLSGDSSSSTYPSLSFADLHFLHRIGSGDIGSVYLVEIKNGRSPEILAAKVMDKKELASRNKEERARREKDILQMLDHPFLPKLYAAVESPSSFCLLTEFCPGGDLHILRQRQPFKRFPYSAVRFYASEVVAALEYLHMMGIVYRDLKPENVLVGSDGHIMLTDFDLSLRCDEWTSTPAQVISVQECQNLNPENNYAPETAGVAATSCVLPSCVVPAVSCFHQKWKRKKKTNRQSGMEVVTEPVDVRSMSFVGTHEYLAPEIVSDEGHGNAVDWWTLGIFIFELFYGVTPFRGLDHEVTFANIVARALEFPKEPVVPGPAKDLILQLLVKDPVERLGSTMGASAIKHHPFFKGLNWALLRCNTPPFVPSPMDREEYLSEESCTDTQVDYY